jgi:uncharacterized protein (DUF1330 family)
VVSLSGAGQIFGDGESNSHGRLDMAAYIIAKIEITDPEKYKTYVAATPPVIARFGGKFIARAGETITLEGPEEKRRVVLLEFPSLDKAKEFYDSTEYREVKKLREGAAVVHIVAIEGVEKSRGHHT